MKLLTLPLLAALFMGHLMTACGGDFKGDRPALSRTSSLGGEKTLTGKDDRGESCSLKVPAEDGGTEVALGGQFKVDYKIPAPLSGLYGVYYWNATFATSSNVIGAPSIGKALFFNKIVFEGRGKPLFWDGTDSLHHLEFKPSLTQPSEVTYHATQRIAGILPFVTVDLHCTF